MEKLNISLSGGGARSIMHLGALEALHEFDIEPSIVAGSSGGAIVGAFYCSGYKPKEALKIISDASITKILGISFNLKGLLNIEKSSSFFEKFIPKNFEDLNTPLQINTTNLETGDSTLFSTESIIQPLLASCAIPGIFSPVKIDSTYYVDGGISDNMPLPLLESSKIESIGFHCNAIGSFGKVSNIKTILERTFHIIVNKNVNNRKNLFNYFVEPPGMAAYKIFDLKKSQEIFDIGYSFTKDFILKEIVN